MKLFNVAADGHQLLPIGIFLLAVLLAAGTTRLSNKQGDDQTADKISQASWPTSFEGKPLTALGLSAKEAGFVRGFPGHIERFSDGQREIIIRQIFEPTRHLHAASTCLEATGYTIKPLAIERNAAGYNMNCFQASPPKHKNTTQVLKVCEWIVDDKEQHWSDVSSWYWSTVFKREASVWWSYAVAEVIEPH